MELAISEPLLMNPLTRYRADKGLSQSDLARIIGTSRGYLHDLEAGRRRASFGLARRIEAVTGVPRERIRPDIFGPAPQGGA